MRQIPLHPFLFMVVVGTAACAKTPVAPTTVTQGAGAPRSITISGTTTLQHPGDAGQLDAVATFPDGTTRNISADAWWTVDRGNVVSVLRGGALTARAYGQCYVTVMYASVSARALVRVIPDGMFLLSGRVTEDSGLPLSQARVRITMSTEQMGATTDMQGFYMLPAKGDSDVRAEADDFEPQLKRVTVAHDEQLDFRLAFSRRGFGGTYRLILVPAASCALPSDAMRRTYIARIAETAAGALTVVLSGAEFVVWGEAGFTGRRDGSALRFNISSDYSDEYQFIEGLDADRELALSGTATAVVGDTLVAAFTGSVVARRHTGAVLARCESSDHRLEFTR